MRSVGLGLIGLGTVGTGVVKILQNSQAHVAERIGAAIRCEQFCDKRVPSRPEVGITADQVTGDYRQLLNNRKIDVIVELIGGYEPARTIILDSLKSGKHVVTANKAVLAMHWDEILATAQKHKRLVYFEAAVGGGIPVIQGLHEGLAANRILKIVGVLNGTTNYILTKMSEEGIPFQEALKEAQSAGFAESDPTFDIEGIDSAHKLAVLSSIAFGAWVRIPDIHCEGITNLDLMDLQLANKEFGYGLKLLGIAREQDGKVEARVHPTFLPLSHPFMAARNEYNAISIEGDAVGDVMFYGKGAGQMAAASAVVSDIIFVARHVAEGTAGRLPYVTYNENKRVRMLDRGLIRSKYYLRFNTEDRPGVLSKISGVLGDAGVSIASVFQPKPKEVQRLQAKGARKADVHILLTTHSALEGNVLKAVARIDRLSFIKSKAVLIRIEE